EIDDDLGINEALERRSEGIFVECLALREGRRVARNDGDPAHAYPPRRIGAPGTPPRHSSSPPCGLRGTASAAGAPGAINDGKAGETTSHASRRPRDEFGGLS